MVMGSAVGSLDSVGAGVGGRRAAGGGVSAGLGGIAAAGGESKHHDEGQSKRKKLLH